MRPRAEVFISASTRELGSYCEEVKNALLTFGIFPIEQTNFRLAYGSLITKLRSLIARCDAVLHLAGFYYGAEPSQRPFAEPRRSYTKRKKYCNWRTGTSSKNAATFTPRSRSTKNSHASSANWSFQTAARKRRPSG
jgi:hypothetical protein